MADPLEQYKELCSDGRHLDHMLWIIPTAAYTIAIAGFSLSAGTDSLANRLMVFGFEVAVLSGFTIQLAKTRLYQLANQTAISRLLSRPEFKDFVAVNQYAATNWKPSKPILPGRLESRISASHVVIIVLASTLIAYLVALIATVIWMLR